MKKIAIIGGGAAGYFAAYHAAKSNTQDSEVVMFEASKNVLAKVLVSGGGRCNVTNNTTDLRELIKKYPRGQKELLAPFRQFGPEETVAWFETRNVKLKIEKDNRIFPVTDKSEAVVNCLMGAVREVGVKVRLDSKIVKISKVIQRSQSFDLQQKNGNIESFDKVVIATGGVKLGYEIAESLGHKIIKPVPSLFTFEIANELLDGLAGISFKDATIALKTPSKKFRNSGPLLITHWGLSGPAVIVLSSTAARELSEAKYTTEVIVNFLTGTNTDIFYQRLCNAREVNPKKLIFNSYSDQIPKAFWERVLILLKVDRRISLQEVSNKTLRSIAEMITNSKFLIIGKGKFKEEFVTAGGVDLKEVNFKTMESKICPGLYFAGEVLDVDGVTGGFNFQAAWTTGYIAGSNV